MTIIKSGFRNMKANWARRGGGVVEALGRMPDELAGKRTAKNRWPIFQSKHESLNKDALEINSFPVQCLVQMKTTPFAGLVSRYFLVCLWTASGKSMIKNGQFQKSGKSRSCVYCLANCKVSAVGCCPVSFFSSQTIKLLLLASSDQLPMEKLGQDGLGFLGNREIQNSSKMY